MATQQAAPKAKGPPRLIKSPEKKRKKEKKIILSVLVLLSASGERFGDLVRDFIFFISQYRAQYTLNLHYTS